MFKDVTSRAIALVALVALVALGSYVEDLGVRDGCDEDMQSTSWQRARLGT
jgi:hypothetical protein